LMEWTRIPSILAQSPMAQFEGAEIEFNLLALVKDPLASKREALASNVRMLQRLESKLNQVFPNWRDVFDAPLDGSDGCQQEFPITDPSPEYGLTSEMIEAASMPELQMRKIDRDDDPNTLFDLRDRLQEKQVSLRISVRDQSHSSAAEFAADRTKAEERRHEYSGYIYDHLKKLAEINALEDIMEDIRAGKNNG
jgi:ubiquitin carboxyl-terminal hydrolase L5